MASYTVIQDIEAEDKLLGPLSLRQFIYAVIVVVLGFIMFRLFLVNPLLAVPFLPPAILFGVLAAPFGHDQSSEIWLLAKIRFFLKPRLRIWNQSGLQELVTVTAPKKVEEILTNGLDETQVRSRLQALAQTIDTRGWALKGVSSGSDRLVDPNAVLVPTQLLDTDTTVADDILDMQNNPVAQQMGQMVQANDEAHRRALLDQMQQIRTTQQAQAAAPAAPAAAPAPQTYQPAPAATPTPVDDQQLAAQLRQNQQLDTQAAYGNTHVLQPSAAPAAEATNTPAATATPTPAEPPMTDAANPDILKLANNDDLSVATISRQVNKRDEPTDEVVVSLR